MYIYSFCQGKHAKTWKLLQAAECVLIFSQDILNHVLNDMEIFMSKVSAAVYEPSLQGNKSSKKKGLMKKKSKKKGNILINSLSVHVHNL